MQQFLRSKVRPCILSAVTLPDDTNPAPRSEARILLDAGESPFNSPDNRYPDPNCPELCAALGSLCGIRRDCVFPASGEAEVIDLLMRIFCTPGRDNVVAPDPTRPMYARLAALNDVEYRRAPLGDDFAFSADAVLQLCNARTKLVILCSPNSPTGNILDRREIIRLTDAFDGLVVIDESYLDFSSEHTFVPELQEHPNIVVVHGFSKAWASAGLVFAAAYSRPELATLLQGVKSPHNLSLPVQRAALALLRRRYDVDGWVKQILDERSKVLRAFRMLPFYICDYPTDTNFFLVRVNDAARIYEALLGEGILVDDCSAYSCLDSCLRITIGAPHENSALLAALRKM